MGPMCTFASKKRGRRPAAAAAFALLATALAAATTTTDAHADPARIVGREAPSGPLSLSLKEALDRAEQRAPDVVLAGRAVQEARALRVGAGVVMPSNPRVSVDARPLFTGGPAGQLGYAATLEMLFDVGGAPSARVREAERAGEMATADLSLERLRGRIAAWIVYLQVRVAEMRIDETKSLVGIAERILRASQQRGAMGAAGDIEESLATVDLGQLHAAIEAATREREEHVATLRDVLDLGSGQPIVLTTPLEEPPPAPNRERAPPARHRDAPRARANPHAARLSRCPLRTPRP